MKNKKQLEIKIQKIPIHPNPKVEFEQYSTPANIAADIMWNAYNLGDICNKDILDLGCGTGIFTISSVLLGAKSAIGVDIDEESLDVAINVSQKFNLNNSKFLKADIKDVDESLKIDTIIQNPPFGSQKFATKGIDLEFIKKAYKINPSVIYSFHMASTEEFLIEYFSKFDLKITHIFRYSFKIPKIYEFHTKEFKNTDVIVLRAKT